MKKVDIFLRQKKKIFHQNPDRQTHFFSPFERHNMRSFNRFNVHRNLSSPKKRKNCCPEKLFVVLL